MNIKFLQAAEQELSEAVAYYEAQEPGLGFKLFENEILIVAVAHLHRKPSYWRHRI